MDNHIFEQQIYEKEYQEEFVDEYEEESQQNYQNAWLLMSFSQSAQENAERMHGHYQQMSEADTVTMEDEDTSAGVEALIMLSAQPTTQSTAPSARQVIDKVCHQDHDEQDLDQQCFLLTPEEQTSTEDGDSSADDKSQSSSAEEEDEIEAASWVLVSMMQQAQGPQIDQQAPPKSCTACDQSFETAVDSLEHFRDAHGLKPKHQCPKCPKSYTYVENLELHLKTHNAKRQCQLCSQSYSSSIALSRHLRVHFDDQCERCGVKFQVRKNLDKHQLHCNVVSLAMTKAWNCETCSEKFLRIECLKKRIRLLGCFTFECVDCNQHFADLKLAQKHFRTFHEGRHICNPCKKKEGRKEFQCPVCKVYLLDQEDFDEHVISTCLKEYAKLRLPCHN